MELIDFTSKYVDSLDFPSLVNTFLDNYGEYERRIGRPFSIQSPSSLYRSYFRGDPPTDETEAEAFGHFKQFEVLAGLGLQYTGDHYIDISGCCIACGFEIDYPSLIDDKLTPRDLMMHADVCAPIRIRDKNGTLCTVFIAQIHLYMHDNGIKDIGEAFLRAQLECKVLSVGLRSHRNRVELVKTEERAYNKRKA